MVIASYSIAKAFGFKEGESITKIKAD